MTDLLNTLSPRLNTIQKDIDVWDKMDGDLTLRELSDLYKDVTSKALKDSIEKRIHERKQQHKLNDLVARAK